MPSAPNGLRVRIVADTNTLVSGSLWSGNPGRLFEGIPIMKAREALEKLGIAAE